jgi:uncharacterized Ntn-hydrolase superfamily protein
MQSMTYSIVARDPATGELGAAVQSRWFSTGSIVTWVQPGVGAVATQSFVEVAHGPNGLARLSAGRSPVDALADLLGPDTGEAVRQLGIVDAAGRSAAHTGRGCVPHAGHRSEPDVSVQANMMERDTVPAAMLAAFRATSGDLAARLIAALRAAEGEGGDVRGRQSAALVVAPGRTEAPAWERRFDLRVEDHRAPLDELERVLRVARAYEAFEATDALLEAGDMTGALARFDEARGLAPEDDQIVLWHAVALVRADRPDEAQAAYTSAVAAEPRAAEHLRRFAAANLLADADRVLAALLEGTRH